MHLARNAFKSRLTQVAKTLRRVICRRRYKHLQSDRVSVWSRWVTGSSRPQLRDGCPSKFHSISLEVEAIQPPSAAQSGDDAPLLQRRNHSLNWGGIGHYQWTNGHAVSQLPCPGAWGRGRGLLIHSQDAITWCYLSSLAKFSPVPRYFHRLKTFPQVTWS